MENLNNIMQRKMTRKEFIKTAGIFILALFIFPSLIGKIFGREKVIERIYANNELIMEVK